MAKSTDIEVTNKYSIPQRRRESVILLNETEQSRLDELINAIEDKPNLWLFGLSISLTAAITLWVSYFLLPLAASAIERRWFFGLALATTFVCLPCLVAFREKKSGRASSKEAVSKEFERLKSQYTVTKEDSEESSGLNIVNGKYYTTKKSIDITQKLQEQVIDDELHVAVTNEFAGEDPDAGTQKDVSVAYVLNGSSSSIDCKEGDTINIPRAN